MNRSELSPLFTDLRLSADDASAIAAALRDVALSDGHHEEELEMIQGLLETLDADLGALNPTTLPTMTPQTLANIITDATTRKAAIQAAVLLAWADGAFSDMERQRILEYATALGFSTETYMAIEAAVTSWVQSGDLEPLF